LPNIKIDGRHFISSDEALNLTELPAKIDIVGGGVIGIHFASIFSTLGTEVTIFEALPEILNGIDDEVIALIKRVLQRKKVNILTSTLFDPTKSANKTLICIGRIPNLQGLEALPLKTVNKSVCVNDKMETSLPGVYAVGDLVSRKMLAHVAYEQGMIAAENALGGNIIYNDEVVPISIYSHPEIGSIGLTEKEAKKLDFNIKTGKFPFGALGIAQALGELEGFIKVISDSNGIILGVHIIGPKANNLLGMATLAMKNKLTVSQLANTFQAHPSLPEGLQEAALNSLIKGLHTLNNINSWPAEKFH
jgi:dihydrolipoamide dehydrogenase